MFIGNSSSGIIEAPSLKLPVVNIGSRNVGREHAKNIIFADPKRVNIKKAIEKALYDKRFQSVVNKCKNPYGKGGTARSIINILKKTELNKKLLLKKITY
jgi:UDP-N-acetylglucosamine 2-epimerase